MHHTLSQVFRALLIFANILTIALYINIWFYSPNNKQLDFISFFTAGSLPYAKLYDVTEQRRVQIGILGKPFPVPSGVLPFVNPPFIVPLVKACVTSDFDSSYLRWRAVLAFVSILNGWLIFLILRSRGWGITNSVIAAVTAMLFLPVYLSLVKGQLSAILVFGVLACAWSLERARDALAGIVLSLALIKPHIALILAASLVFTYTRAFLWFLIAALALALLSLSLVGLNGARELLNLNQAMALADDYGVRPEAMFNLLGLLLRFGTALNVARAVAWCAYIIAIALSCVAGWRFKDHFQALSIAALLAIFAAPHLHFHDLYLLLLPMTCAADTLTKRGVAATVAMLAFVPLSFIPLLVIAPNFMPYALTGIIAFVLARSIGQSTSSRDD
jgi:hypothetical protein